MIDRREWGGEGKRRPKKREKGERGRKRSRRRDSYRQNWVLVVWL